MVFGEKISQDIWLSLSLSLSLTLSLSPLSENQINLSEAAIEAILEEKAFSEIPQNSQAETCNFIKKETPVQLFPCEFCEISKNTF